MFDGKTLHALPDHARIDGLHTPVTDRLRIGMAGRARQAGAGSLELCAQLPGRLGEKTWTAPRSQPKMAAK
jgi:hypothetical protein